MEWKNRNNEEPKAELNCILVWGNCGYPHIAFQDYGGWCHTECCYDHGGHFSGQDIDFIYWKPIPEPPIDKNKL